MQINKVFSVLCIGILIVFGACKRETKDERFKREYEQYTQKECPKEVSLYTRLDSVCYSIENRTLTEYYTVWDVLEDKSFYTEETTEALHNDILKELKGSIRMKPYKDEGITFCYDYRSQTSGERVIKLTYTPEDYGK